MERRAGVISIGMYVPPDARSNEWWASEHVARWREQRRTPAFDGVELTPGQKRVLAGYAAFADDPFQGVRERRAMPLGMSVFDMEERAAREAIERAGIDPAAIDLLLTHTVVPDYMAANSACILHERLALPTGCLALHTEATAYSFFAQLAIAEAAIVAGRARHALLVQSFAGSLLIPPSDPGSGVVGDGASAVVVGETRGQSGVLALAHYTEGRYANGLVMSVPGGRWFDDGPATLHVADATQLLQGQLRSVDACAEAVTEVLRKAAYRLSDVDAMVVFQGTAWMESAVYEHVGFRARERVDVFSRLGYLASATIPITMYLARQQDVLHDGDLVVLTGGGTGMTYGAAAMRWEAR